MRSVRLWIIELCLVAGWDEKDVVLMVSEMLLCVNVLNDALYTLHNVRPAAIYPVPNITLLVPLRNPTWHAPHAPIYQLGLLHLCLVRQVA